MTTYINNNDLDIQTTSLSDGQKAHSQADHHEAISTALANVSDRLDEGNCDEETFKLVAQLKATLTAAANGEAPVPTTLLPGVPTPASLLPGVPTPTSLIPPTPTELVETVGLIHRRAIQQKLFQWIRIYTINALYTMPGSMLENSAAIQKYMTDGLNKLSEVVMKDSQAWSEYGQACMVAIEDKIQHTPSTDPTYAQEISNLTTAFNTQNTFYQKNLELFSSLNDGINQTTTTTTQTQTLNNQNITQGPLAMITMLTQCWNVAA